MDSACIGILHGLIETRRSFFRRSNMYRRNQEEIVLNFIAAEREFLQIMNRILNRQTVVAFTVPFNIPAGFSDPVPVVPTAEQITNELIDFEATTQASCAICQDSLSSGACRLRGCNHYYHRACIQTWFCASSLCPVCRRDIRGGPEEETSSVSGETYPPDMYL